MRQQHQKIHKLSEFYYKTNNDELKENAREKGKIFFSKLIKLIDF